MDLVDTNGAGAAGGDGNAGGDGGQGGGASALIPAGVIAGGGADTAAAGAGADTVNGGGGNDAGMADPDWYSQVSGDVGEGEKASLRDWLKAAGVKDINGLAKVARDNQAALRASGMVKVPGEGAKAEELAAFHKAIGVPDDAKGYTIGEIKDGQGNVVELDSALLDRLALRAHAIGVPKSAYEGLVSEYVQSEIEAASLRSAEEHAEATAKLKEWGGQANAKIAAIDSAARQLGLNADELLGARRVWGAGRAMEIFAKLGEGLAEDTLIAGGRPARFGISAAQAQEQIDQMRADPATLSKMSVKGTPERARYDRLLAVIGAEDERKARAGE